MSKQAAMLYLSECKVAFKNFFQEIWSFKNEFLFKKEKFLP